MNDRMEREIRRTIQLLQASMPEPRNRQTPVFTLLRIAAGEINAGLLLGLFAGALIFGLLSVRALSMPMLTIFCTAPCRCSCCFHRYVLSRSERMLRQLSCVSVFLSEVLAARSARDLMLHVPVRCCQHRDAAHFCFEGGSSRLALWRGTGASVVHPFAAVSVYDSTCNPEGSPCLRSSSGRRSASPRDNCFHLTDFCSSLLHRATLQGIGLILYGMPVHNVQRREERYDVNAYPDDQRRSVPWSGSRISSAVCCILLLG